VKLTPTDVQRQSFSSRFRGFDPDEVRAFLAAVAEEMAALQRDRDAVDQQLRHLELIVGEHRERESILKNTLLTAQKASEDIREAAARAQGLRERLILLGRSDVVAPREGFFL